MSSHYHQKSLLKVLDEKYITNDTSVEYLATMRGNVIESYHVSFSEEKLSFEGIIHNKVLHIIVNYRGYTINGYCYMIDLV